jgi:hypothetical protein
VEDRVDGFVDQIHQVSQSAMAGTHTVSLRVQKMDKEFHPQIEGWWRKFKRNMYIIDKEMVHLEEELEKVVDLAGQRIKTEVGAIASDFAEVMEIEETRWSSSEAKIVALEEKLEQALSHIAHLAGLVTNVQTRVGELEDAVMEESDDDTEGEVVSSSSSTDVEPVENMVAIPIPAPLVIHTLIPIGVPEEFIPPSLRSTPSPPYVQACEKIRYMMECWSIGLTQGLTRSFIDSPFSL